MKTSIRNLPDSAQRGPAADLEKSRTRKDPAGAQADQNAAKGFDIHQSPRMVAQRAALDAHFGSAAKPAATDSPALQMKREVEASGLPGAQAAPRVNNTGLPEGLKAGIESLSGMAMDGVKVHYNSAKPAQLNALAYAQGTDIHVAPGQEQHLPHEAWHVVQQAQGRVSPTKQMHGGAQINDDKGLEREADLIGARAASGIGQSALQNGGLHGNTAQLVHAKGCSCSGCGQKMAATAATASTLQAKSISTNSLTIQLAPCPLHKDDPGYDGHSDRKCPDMQEDEPSEEAQEVQREVAAPKKQGWQKNAQGVKMGLGERDLRKRDDHGMMSKEQAKRYVKDYKK